MRLLARHGVDAQDRTAAMREAFKQQAGRVGAPQHLAINGVAVDVLPPPQRDAGVVGVRQIRPVIDVAAEHRQHRM
ncbi:MAG: hypothetical protein N3A53_02170, partial [Verrucomicrobiae bacterium]|nr:hypothetical protein [Verrucomicrobiae bacterium]